VRAGPRWPLFIVFWLAVSGGVDLYPSVASAEEAATGQQAIAEAVSLLNQGKPKKAAQQLGGPMSSDDAYTEAAAQYYAGLCLRRLDRGKQAVGRWSRVENPAAVTPQPRTGTTRAGSRSPDNSGAAASAGAGCRCTGMSLMMPRFPPIKRRQLWARQARAP